MKRLGKIILVAFLLLLVAGVGVGVWAWGQVKEAPEWYAPPDPADVEVSATAERVEYGMVQEFHKIRVEPVPWRVRITEQEINSWFSARLPDWIAHEQHLQWPEALGAPQVRVTATGLELALQVGDAEGGRVLVARVVPTLAEGQLHLDVEQIGVGRLLLRGPTAGRVLDVLEGALPADLVGEELAPILIGMLSGEEALGSDFDLSDGHRVELVDLVLREGSIEFTSLTHPPE